MSCPEANIALLSMPNGDDIVLDSIEIVGRVRSDPHKKEIGFNVFTVGGQSRFIRVGGLEEQSAALIFRAKLMRILEKIHSKS